MKLRNLLSVGALVLALTVTAIGQQSSATTQNLAGNGSVVLGTVGFAGIGFQITGTWVGTINFEGSVDCFANPTGTYTAINVFPPTSTTGQTTTTSNGIFQAGAGGFACVRARMSGYMSGTAVVNIRSAISSAKAATGGGGGGGGGISSIATTSPITGGPITTTGTIACATCGVTGTGLQQFASTTSAQLAGTISDETGSGALVFGTAPVITLVNATGLPGGTCTNQVATAIGGNGAPTCTTVTSAYVDGSIPTATSTTTFTNKRLTKRITTAADATSVTPNSDNADITYQLNTQAGGTLTINADGGTPTNGQSWVLKVKTTNAQTFSWNSLYAGGTTALPTVTTGTSKIDYFAFIYDTVSTKWQYTGTAGGF